MGKLRVAFYKSEMGGLDDKFIDKFSGNKGYSHCELIINSKTTISAHMQSNGIWISKYPNIYESEYYDVYELNISKRNKSIQKAISMVGVPYDYIGVALWFIGLKFGDSKNKFWCSEYLAYIVNDHIALSKRDDFIEDTRVMPNELIEIFKDKYNARLLKPSTHSSRDKKDKKYELDRWGRIVEKSHKINWFWRLFN